jgi:hypothetical protein
MAGKTVAQKLQIKPNASVWLSEKTKAPLLDPLPEGAKHVARLEHATVAILFAEDGSALRKLLAKVGAERLARPEVLWIAYPKGNRSDINRDSVWPIVAELGMRPIGQVAVDEVWSALRFRPLEPGEGPFTGGR